ncbi:MAG: hypothetical protein K5985_04105 [Lachnospiraceae bacterium]|nr:hypothetical protein [Lachnospiraceae bacterium]
MANNTISGVTNQDNSIYNVSAAVNASNTEARQGTAAAEKDADKDAEKTVGAVYEKSGEEADSKTKAGLYSINKMSESDRSALVAQLKQTQAENEQRLLGIVQKMMTGQATAYSKATGTEMWRFLASGEYEVDPETKAQAQQDISEDGYWGVKQTSQRLFDFASALAGDDVDKMKEMQEAMQKGYKMAEETWGKELPEISKQTINAANQLFEEYYKSKETSAVEV